MRPFIIIFIFFLPALYTLVTFVFSMLIFHNSLFSCLTRLLFSILCKSSTLVMSVVVYNTTGELDKEGAADKQCL